MTSRVLIALTVSLAVLGTGSCSDDDGGDPQAFCDAAADSATFEAVFAEFDPTDVDSAISKVRAARDAEEELRSAAPEAVQADVDILVRYLEDLLEGLESPEATAGDRPPVYDELRARADQVDAASARIDLYVSTNC